MIVNPEITWETPEKLWSLKIKTWLNFKPALKSFIDWNLDLIQRSLEPLIPGSIWATTRKLHDSKLTNLIQSPQSCLANELENVILKLWGQML